MNKTKRNVLYVGVGLSLIFLVGACVFVLSSIYRNVFQGPDCQFLAENTPEPPPVYPGSTLIERKDISDNDAGFWYKLTYETTGSSQEVLEYYNSALSDGCSFYYLTCSGDAQPVGEYSVDIRESNPTVYVISVWVTRCNLDW
jgi:hypothetical protein